MTKSLHNQTIMLQLKNELCFFDIETTGLNVLRDRIIQIALIKYLPGVETPKELSMLLNPGIPISEEAMAIHNITPNDVANKPTFAQVADQIFSFIGDADLAGYNSNRFDIPVLMEEFNRSGVEFSIQNRRTIDVQRIFYKMEPRTLKAAYKFYCNGELDDAHDALEDVRATVAVLQGQLSMYEGASFKDDDGNSIPNPVTNDVQALHDFTADLTQLDPTQRIRYDTAGNIVFNFGKYIGRNVGEICYQDRNYYHWIQDKEFSIQLKNMCKKLLAEYELKMKVKDGKSQS